MDQERTPEQEAAIERGEELRREMSAWRKRMGFEKALQEPPEHDRENER